jgi:hypothetical protein
MNSMLGNALGGVSDIFTIVDNFMTDTSVDILYKAFAVIGVLTALFFIPATTKFASWTAAILLLILCLQSSSTPTQQTAASSTLPLPTQINTPVPASGSSGQVASTGSGSSGSSILGDIGTALSIAALFA